MRFQLELRLAAGEEVSPAMITYRQRRMARVTAAMTDLKLTVDAGPPPKFPLWAVYGVSDFDSSGRPMGGRAQEYEAALRRILAAHGNTEEEGIPLHKLRSNLGWHVTADECRAAMKTFDAIRRPDEPVPGVLGPILIGFLRAAMVRDGFEVH
ncbi:MAG TPA: hypothetical protein VH333_04465 [Pseudonocardiaceae bacterium]|nr:hypothetical protein [Pseudonocardiaceae bacterium]